MLTPDQIQQARSSIGLAPQPQAPSPSGISSMRGSQLAQHYLSFQQDNTQTADAPIASAIHSTASALGMDKFGTGIGLAVNNATGAPDQLLQASQQHRAVQGNLAAELNKPGLSPEQRSHIANILSSSKDYASDAYNDVSTGGLSNKDVLGSAAQTALNIATAGIGGGTGATGFARIGSAALKGAAIGGAQGTASDKSCTTRRQ